jgi:hypothetical protein
MLKIKGIALIIIGIDYYFFFRVIVDDPRILDRPGFLPEFLGMLRLRLGFESGGVKL